MLRKKMNKDTKTNFGLFGGLVVVLFLLSAPSWGQQEQMYSQYMFNMLHLNPAYAGNRVSDNITGLYRMQWVGLPGAPRTGTLSWDRRQDQSNVGYGVELYNDRLGVENTSGIQLFYSYHIPFENSSLALGLSAGVLNYRADLMSVKLEHPNDPMFQQNIDGWLPTVGFGLLYSTDKWYAGFSIPALLHTKVAAATRNTFLESQYGAGADNHYFLTGGYIFDITQDVKLKPSLLVKAVRGAPVEFDINLNAWFSDFIGVGVSYRTGDSWVAMVELQLTKELRLGYSYDYTFTRLGDYNSGTHEILLRYEIPRGGKEQKILSPRYY